MSLCLSERQTSISEGKHLKSLTEKEMSVLDMNEESGDEGDGKDAAMASSTGDAQVHMEGASTEQGTFTLDTVPGLCAERKEILAHIEEREFSVHMPSDVEQFPALRHIEVEECPAQTPTEEFYI